MKKCFVFTIVLILSLSYLSAQNYAVGYKYETLRDVSRNRNISVLIYYPATTAGANQPALHNGNKFPVVSFGHGFLMKGEEFTYLAQKFCPLGYIFIFPKTEEGLPPNHGEFGKDEVFCALEMARRDTLTNDFFNGIVADKKAVGGHSMGGGAAFLGLQTNPDIDAFFALAPAQTFIGGSAITAAQSIRIPGLVFTGTLDKVAPRGGNGGSMYNNLISTCKTFIEIKGASHCGFSNETKDACDLGELAVCLGCNFISNAEQHATVFKYLEPWLNFWLKGTSSGLNTIVTQGVTDTKIIFTNSCTITAIQNHEKPDDKSIQLFPNPASTSIQVQSIYPVSKIEIWSMDGKLMQEIANKWMPNDDIQLPASDLQNGMYIVRCYTDKGVAVKSIIIQ